MTGPTAETPAGATSSSAGSSPPAALVAGRGVFLSDLVSRSGTDGSDLLHACFSRSPYASGRVSSVDAEEVRARAGVAAVLTARDLRVTMPGVNRFDLEPSLPAVAAMAGERISWAGQALAIVLAADPEVARAGAEEISFEIEPDESWAGMQPVARWRVGDTDRKAAAADRTVHAVIEQPRVAATALEPRGVFARVGHDGRLEIWVPTQSPARARDEFAAALGLAAAQVHVRVPDVGGAFGSKATPGPDELLVAAAAWVTGRPVAWVATRSEEFLAGVHGRGGRLEASLGCSREGRLESIEATLRFPVGAWLPYSALVPARNAARLIPGPYRVPSSVVDAEVVTEPRAAVNIYRGAGRPEAALLVEHLVDDAARALGRDPLALRLENLIGASDMPWSLPSGESLDSGDPRAALEHAAERFGYEAERASVARRRAAGERVGLGIGCYLEPCGQGFERARLTLDVGGHVTLATGTASQGQGHGRPFERLVREVLGAEVTGFTLIEGDTDRCPDGTGALASRSMAIGGSAVRAAAEAVLARRAAGQALPLSETVRYDAPAEAFGHGAVIVRIVLMPDTFAPRIERLVWVDDCGRVLDERGVRAQQLGGMAQGVGQALSEALRYDDQHQLLTGSLMDYALPRAADMPVDVSLHAQSTLTAANALGAKGIGEAGCIGVPAAVLNAVRDALAEGRELPAELPLQFPLTGERVWRAARWLESRGPGSPRGLAH